MGTQFPPFSSLIRGLDRPDKKERLLVKKAKNYKAQIGIAVVIVALILLLGGGEKAQSTAAPPHFA